MTELETDDMPCHCGKGIPHLQSCGQRDMAVHVVLLVSFLSVRLQLFSVYNRVKAL